MGEIALFPGVAEVFADPEVEPELDPGTILARQSGLLLRWKVLGEELQRRAEHPLPFDLALDLHDLLDETDG